MHVTRLRKQYAYVNAGADFAGDKTDSASTSGVFVAAIGLRTYVPVEAISKKQICSSHSTCEAEVAAMNLGLNETLPLLDFWESVHILFCPVGTGAGKDPGRSGAGQKSASAAGGTDHTPRLTGRLAGADRFETSSLDSEPAELHYVF
jgi:hypothetical protein